MSELKTLHELFIHELQDVLSAEQQLTKALPKMIEGAENEELRAALENHLEETEEQATMVRELLESMDGEAKAERCEAMAGILKECDSMLKPKAPPAVRDAAIIAGAQKVEHYEIATYGTLREWAEQMGHDKAVETLSQIFDQEVTADETLSEIARSINDDAHKKPKSSAKSSKKTTKKTAKATAK